MTISNLLLNELSTWPIVSVPGRFYHGCCFGDQGVDVCANLITGNKWFSIDRHLAGDYAWHWSRLENAKMQKMRVELELTHPHMAVSQPTRIGGDKWVPFLAKCFPGIDNYQLSREFQNNLKAHLNALGNPNVESYCSNGGREICIREVERFVRIVSVTGLPNDREVYRSSNI